MPEFRVAAVGCARVWDELVERSPQGTLFSTSEYLESCGCPTQRWFVYKGLQLRAGLCMAVSPDGERAVLDDLLIYNGILFEHEPSGKPTKWSSEDFKLTEFVAQWFENQYREVALALAPQFADLRPFLWHNYHEPDARRYQTSLRYTSYVDISELRQEKDEPYAAFAAMHRSRRQLVVAGIKRGVRVTKEPAIAMLVSCYEAMMTNQGRPPSADYLRRISQLLEHLIACGRAAMYTAHDSVGEPAYSVVYGIDSKRAYYLFGAGRPDRDSSIGTVIHWEAFKDLARTHRLDEVDLEGVNSPQRGSFKLGFGGGLRSYFHVSLSETAETAETANRGES